MQKTIKELVLLLFSWILFSPTQVLSLTGLCETNSGQEVCSACSSISANIVSLARDCCEDSDAYAICTYCFHNPGQCQTVAQIISNIINDADFFEPRQTRSESSNKEGLPYYIPPQRRAKYFLGKRNGLYLSHSRPDFWADDMDLDKRARPFLGKRSSRPFLGKRLDDEDLYEKRARPFLGKRDVSYLQTPEISIEENLDKRGRPFLGKRSDSETEGMENGMTWTDKENSVAVTDDDEKRGRPFLGKREDDADKRGRPFLGKREDVDKKARPFLGKRTEDDEKRGRPFLGKRGNDMEKRARPFLGKRGGSYFLGKRAETDKDSLDDEYISPFTRRAKYFLGKRADSTKRQKYFLGKRTMDENEASGLSTQEDKRQSYFLGKRSSL